MAIIILLNRYYDDPIILFVMSMFICSLLEYFTSYIMEKLFKARWWDYSHKKYHINGRICIDNVLAFGILGLLMMYFINPFFVKCLNLVNSDVLNVIAIIIGVIYIADNIISLKVISGFKKVAKSINKDSTEEITKKVRELLTKRGGLYKRLVSAFNFEASEKLLKNIKAKVKHETLKAKRVISRGIDKSGETKEKIIADYKERIRELKEKIKIEKEIKKEKLKKIK